MFSPISGCGSKPMAPFFWVGAPPIFVYFSGDWDIHWGYEILTHPSSYALRLFKTTQCDAPRSQSVHFFTDIYLGAPVFGDP